MTPMRITVVGAGALGQLFGGLLARAGHTVSFVARGEALAAIASHGLTVVAPGGPFSTGPLKASASPAELGASNLVIVAVKTWQVEGLAASLAPLVTKATVVLPLQNGVEAADQLASALGQDAVVGAVCRVLATREAPDRVRYVGPAPEIEAGERAGGQGERLERIVNALREAGFTARVSPDIQVALWAKLLFVEPFGAVGAVTRCPAEAFRAVPETRAMLEQAMREVQAVAAGRGVRVPDEAVAKSLARIDALPAGAMASMHRDLVEGRPSELEGQTGAVVRLGKQAGAACPVHDFLYASLLPGELRSRR